MRGGKRPGAGRPKGVPNKTSAEFAELARMHAKDALEVVLRLMTTSDDDKVRLQAAQFVIERGYGKPATSIDARMSGDMMVGAFVLPSQMAQDE